MRYLKWSHTLIQEEMMLIRPSPLLRKIPNSQRLHVPNLRKMHQNRDQGLNQLSQLLSLL